MKKFVVHNLLKLYAYKDWLYFARNLNNVAKTQEKRLTAILKSLPKTHPNYPLKKLDDFKQLPLSDYSTWKQYIDHKSLKTCKICNDLIRYQPTSGSSDKLKWIPYNKSYLSAVGSLANVWLFDLYRTYPKLKHGAHYWSLSWLSEELRDEIENDDSELLGKTKQRLLSLVFPVPKSVVRENSLKTSLKLTAIHLLKTEDLSLISIWSPTFLFSILDIIEKEKVELLKVIDEKFESNEDLIQKVKSFDIKNIYQTWPKLELISSWDTSTSKTYATKLKKIFNKSHFQGKGLWATEGVVTIPFNGEMHLAYSTHYFEFLNLDSKKIMDVYELTAGDRVMPIISTQNGILRYKTNDELIVTGFNKACPTLSFVGRLNTVDLVGEKIDQRIAQDIITRLRGNFIIAVKSPIINEKPYYLLVSKTSGTDELEDLLLRNFHYKLARELGQLAISRTLVIDDPEQLYLDLCSDKGMILGNVKPEILMSIESDERLTTKR